MPSEIRTGYKLLVIIVHAHRNCILYIHIVTRTKLEAMIIITLNCKVGVRT
jgi:Cft2 family RNA processing exonuclease